MAQPICIRVADADEGADLVDALAVRGLTGNLVYTNGTPEVLIRYRWEETQRLTADVVAALETWLEDRGRISVAVRVGEGSFLARRARSAGESRRKAELLRVA